MATIHVFADESGTHAAAPFLLIGGLWVPESVYPVLTAAIVDLCNQHRHEHEVKWEKVAPRFLGCYTALIDLFASMPGVAFNCISIDKGKTDYAKYSQSDPELGFYKFYYQLISHRLEPGNSYYLRLDRRRNMRKFLGTLKDCCNSTFKRQYGLTLDDPVTAIQAVNSERNPVLQLADVLLGAVAASYESVITKPEKLALIQHIQATFHLSRLDQGTPWRLKEKFNVWQFQL